MIEKNTKEYKNTNKKYIIYGLVLTLILCIGFSVAFFTAQIQGEGKKVVVKSGQLNIVFTDTQEIDAKKVRPDWTTSKTFTVENESTKVFYYNIYIDDLINTLETEGYLQYKITSTNGYNMSEFKPISKSLTASSFELANSVSIEGGQLQEYTIEFRYVNDPDVDQSGDMGKNFSGHLEIRENTNPTFTLYSKILSDHKTVNSRTNFDSVLGDSTATTGVIYKESTYREDTSTGAANNKDVYYFAGNVADNWVKFAGKMWRIIRTNEDGSVRLLYHGTSTTADNSYIATSYAYNPTYNNTMYVGWMYGSTGDLSANRGNSNSPQIKTKLESWYGTDLASYDNAISKTAIYCNDRSGDSYASSGTMYYAEYKRLIDNKRPTYKCGGSATSTSLYGDANVADRFSKSTASGGNGKLSQPIGLMTADEVAFAGGVYGTKAPNTYYYLNSSGGSSTGQYWWWTMSPRNANSSNAVVFFANCSGAPGQLWSTDVYNTGSPGAAVRPVISLKSCVTWKSGNGSADSPYEIEISDACSALEN